MDHLTIELWRLSHLAQAIAEIDAVVQGRGPIPPLDDSGVACDSCGLHKKTVWNEAKAKEQLVAVQNKIKALSGVLRETPP